MLQERRSRRQPELPAEWNHYLAEIGKHILIPVEVHCIGGFAAMGRYGARFAAKEIHYVATVPPRGVETLRILGGEDSEMARRHGLSLQFSGNAEYIEDYERRLEPIFSGRFGNLRLYAMEAHDLVLAALDSRHAADLAVMGYLVRSRFLKKRVLKRRYKEGLRPYVAQPQRLDRIVQGWLEQYF